MILMTCKELEGLTTEYLEKALPSPKLLDFEAHLEGCANCQKYLGGMRVLIEASHKLGGKLNDEWRTSAGQAQGEFFERLEARALKKPRTSKEWFRKLAPATALILVVIIGGVWIHHRSVERTPKNLTIDLSHWLLLRGGQQPAQQSVQLESAPLNLTIRLPLGDEPGEYQVAVRRDGTTFVTAKTYGKFEDHITTLHMRLDCSSLKAGAYVLAIRQDEWDWQEYPALVHK